jgi:hypothetical protein
MKRYGDNLPSKCGDEIEDQRGGAVQVIRGGCGVRYDMLAYLQPADTPRKRKSLNIFSFFKFAQKKNKENGG